MKVINKEKNVFKFSNEVIECKVNLSNPKYKYELKVRLFVNVNGIDSRPAYQYNLVALDPYKEIELNRYCIFPYSYLSDMGIKEDVQNYLCDPETLRDYFVENNLLPYLEIGKSKHVLSEYIQELYKKKENGSIQISAYLFEIIFEDGTEEVTLKVDGIHEITYHLNCELYFDIVTYTYLFLHDLHKKLSELPEEQKRKIIRRYLMELSLKK